MVTEKNFFRSGFLEFDDLPKVISMTLSYKVVKGANKKNFPTHNNNNSEYYLTCRLSLQVEILRFRAHYKASSSYAQCVKYSPPPPAAFERRENVASPLSPRHAKKKKKKSSLAAFDQCRGKRRRKRRRRKRERRRFFSWEQLTRNKQWHTGFDTSVSNSRGR